MKTINYKGWVKIAINKEKTKLNPTHHESIHGDKYSTSVRPSIPHE